MTSWADGSGQAYKDLDNAQSGTGATLPGQHAVTPAERAKYNANETQFKNDEGPRLVEATKHLPREQRLDGATEKMVSAHKIGAASSDEMWGGKQEYLKAAQKQPLGDLTDPAARLKAMSFITQDRPLRDGEKATDATDDKSACAGASVVGAAFLAEGPEGLKKVISAIEKQDPEGNLTSKKYATPEYTKLKEKLAKDPNSLTVADIQALQQTTKDVLHRNQSTDDSLNLEEGETAIHGKTLDKFMQNSPELATMMEKNGMQIEGIDNDGLLDDNNQTGMDHWVVRMKGPDGKEAIYDPLARRGGQVIDFDEGVNHYKNARQDIVGREGL